MLSKSKNIKIISDFMILAKKGLQNIPNKNYCKCVENVTLFGMNLKRNSKLEFNFSQRYVHSVHLYDTLYSYIPFLGTRWVFYNIH